MPRWTSSLFVTLALAILVAPLAAAAPPVGKVWRLGVLILGPPDRGLGPFRQGLRDLGYVEGQHIVLEPRWAEGRSAYSTRKAERVSSRVCMFGASIDGLDSFLPSVVIH
jgi:hypothetical protein